MSRTHDHQIVLDLNFKKKRASKMEQKLVKRANMDHLPFWPKVVAIVYTFYMSRIPEVFISSQLWVYVLLFILIDALELHKMSFSLVSEFTWSCSAWYPQLVIACRGFAPEEHCYSFSKPFHGVLGQLNLQPHKKHLENQSSYTCKYKQLLQQLVNVQVHVFDCKEQFTAATPTYFELHV
eukprot:5395610-Amphidinium_carterae.1